MNLVVWQLAWYSVILLIGGGGNLTVMVVMLRSKRISKSSSFNILVLALAVVDLTTAISGVTNYVLSEFYDGARVTMHGNVFCRAVTSYFVSFWLCLMSVFILTLIALERRKAILYPFSTLRRRKWWVTPLNLAIVFLISFLIEIPWVLGLHYDEDNPTIGKFCASKYSKAVNITVSVVIFVIQYTIPLLVFSITWKQINSRFQIMTGALKAESKNEKQNRGGLENPSKFHLRKQLNRRWRTVRAMTMVFIGFFVCITPNEVLYALSRLVTSPGISFNSFPYQLSIMLKISNCCINPILYSFYSPTFRQNFRDIIPQSCHRCMHRLRRNHKTAAFTINPMHEILSLNIHHFDRISNSPVRSEGLSNNSPIRSGNNSVRGDNLDDHSNSPIRSGSNCRFSNITPGSMNIYSIPNSPLRVESGDNIDGIIPTIIVSNDSLLINSKGIIRGMAENQV